MSYYRGKGSTDVLLLSGCCPPHRYKARSLQALNRGLAGAAEEEDRKRKNEDAYRRALGGSLHALTFLKQRTGNHGILKNFPAAPGTVYWPTAGDIGGWATATARDDAQNKYQTALSWLYNNPSVPTTGTPTAPGPTPTTPPPGGVTPTPVPDGEPLPPTSGPPQTLPPVEVIGTPDPIWKSPAVLIGAALVGGLLLLPKPRRA